MNSRKERRILVMGAGGRDFHNFNLLFRDDPGARVVAFTATQIPFQAGRRYPASLAGPLYPDGIPIIDQSELASLIGSHEVREVVFAYSDISHGELMAIASQVLALGADFRLVAPDSTMLSSKIPVISVCAVRTGCGKSPVTRHLCRLLRDMGRRPVVVRHPMAYGRLDIREVERFVSPQDLDSHQCTIEEREEYEPLVEMGVPLYAGIDYGKILEQAELEGDVLIWDGGNNDLPFYRPDLELVLVDPWRAGDESSHYPGFVNLLRADAIIVTKDDAEAAEGVGKVLRSARIWNPGAALLRGRLNVTASDGSALEGKRVVVVEDGPTLTHGGMSFGAGVVAARRYGAREIVDPRPFAVGSLAETYRKYPHLEKVVPAMGYSEVQICELKETLEAIPCDALVSATPVDLGGLLKLGRPLVRIGYEFEQSGGPPLSRMLEEAISGAESRR